MPRKARQLSASGIYHIMLRGIDKMQLFLDDADNINFLHLLDFYQDETFEVLAYCLMGNHAHLLVKTSREDMQPLEHAMKGIGIRYATYYNKRYNRVGPLFQGRYKSQPVESTHYFLRVLRYIHNNPVAAVITPTMDAYQWSSYLDYFGTRKSFVMLTSSMPCSFTLWIGCGIGTRKMKSLQKGCWKITKRFRLQMQRCGSWFAT